MILVWNRMCTTPDATLTTIKGATVEVTIGVVIGLVATTHIFIVIIV